MQNKTKKSPIKKVKTAANVIKKVKVVSNKRCVVNDNFIYEYFPNQSEILE